ncbi:lectin-like domain-containing protein [Levilactobacillus acidifarinae]|nr:WxL domain-containing protein [Levilactobacillus acidifarinae]
MLIMGLTSGVTAHADSAEDHALATAPAGMTLTGDDASLTTSDQAANQAGFVPIRHGQAVALTTGEAQAGAVWSTNTHAFHLTQNQTIAAWVYLGCGQQASDGLAFVLQNDSRMVNATPQFGATPIGETLGVWGIDADPFPATATALSRTAIQNSWALALSTGRHTQANATAPGQANSFDLGATTPYLAAGYPGSGTTYQRHKVSGTLGGLLTPNRYYYSLALQGRLAVPNLANGQWHHVTLRWRAATHTMTVIVNDRQATTNAAESGTRRTVNVDLNRVDPNHTGYARWGLTAATSTGVTAPTLAVLTQSPRQPKQVTSAVKPQSKPKMTTRATNAHAAVTVTSHRSVQVPSTHPTTVTGRVTPTGTASARPTVQVTLNGQRLATTKPQPNGKFAVTIDAAQLRPGTDRVKLVAQTATRRTEPTTVALHVAGKLTFAALSTAPGFQKMPVATKNELVTRQPGWQIVVQDTRGTGSRWTLSAQSGTFVNETTGRPMAGAPVYVTDGTMTPLSRVPTTIMTHTTNDAQADGKTNVLAQWSAKTGILLHAQPGTAAGRYHGTITWTLNNAPE